MDDKNSSTPDAPEATAPSARARHAGVIAAVLSEKPNTAFAQLGRIGGLNLCFVMGLILRVFCPPANPARFSRHRSPLRRAKLDAFTRTMASVT